MSARLGSQFNLTDEDTMALHTLAKDATDTDIKALKGRYTNMLQDIIGKSATMVSAQEESAAFMRGVVKYASIFAVVLALVCGANFALTLHANEATKESHVGGASKLENLAGDIVKTGSYTPHATAGLPNAVDAAAQGLSMTREAADDLARNYESGNGGAVTIGMEDEPKQVTMMMTVAVTSLLRSEDELLMHMTAAGTKARYQLHCDVVSCNLESSAARNAARRLAAKSHEDHEEASFSTLLNQTLAATGMAGSRRLSGDTPFPWTQLTSAAGWKGRRMVGAVVLDNKVLLLGGENPAQSNDVWESADGGASWTQLTSAAGWSGRSGHGAVVLGDKVLVLGGWGLPDWSHHNDVWESADGGASWTQLTSAAGWSARNLFGAVVLGNKVLVLGGGSNSWTTGSNDVWESADGASWTQLTSSAGWSGRLAFQAVVLGDKVLVLGGYSDGTYLNDVWGSADGASWTQLTSAAGWEARQAFGAAVLGDKVLVFGGYVCCGTWQVSSRNDLWESADGASWTEVMSSSGWSTRYHHAAVTLGHKVLMFGGAPGGHGRRNDVWQRLVGCSPPAFAYSASPPCVEGFDVGLGQSCTPRCTGNLHPKESVLCGDDGTWSTDFECGCKLPTSATDATPSNTVCEEGSYVEVNYMCTVLCEAGFHYDELVYPQCTGEGMADSDGQLILDAEALHSMCVMGGFGDEDMTKIGSNFKTTQELTKYVGEKVESTKQELKDKVDADSHAVQRAVAEKADALESVLTTGWNAGTVTSPPPGDRRLGFFNPRKWVLRLSKGIVSAQLNKFLNAQVRETYMTIQIPGGWGTRRLSSHAPAAGTVSVKLGSHISMDSDGSERRAQDLTDRQSSVSPTTALTVTGSAVEGTWSFSLVCDSGSEDCTITVFNEKHYYYEYTYCGEAATRDPDCNPADEKDAKRRRMQAENGVGEPDMLKDRAEGRRLGRGIRNYRSEGCRLDMTLSEKNKRCR